MSRRRHRVVVIFGAVARGEGALRAFDELDAACAADTACHDTYGDTDELMARAAASLDADPHRTTVEGHDGKQHEVSIDGGDLYAGLFKAMYDETLIPVLPAAMTAIADGDRGIIDAISKDSIPFVTDQVEAMTTSVDCADREAILDPASLAPFVAEHPEVATLVYLGAAETGCGEWGVAANPPPFNELLTAEEAGDIPILVVAGRFDPVTPSPGTTRVAEALGKDVLLFPDAGHGASTSSDWARSIWAAFLDDPATDPDTTCMTELTPPNFP